MASNDSTRYFEDIEIADTMEFGEYHVTKEEIVEFGRTYDPQPFHVGEESARETIFGELIASGWHTAAVCTRLFVEGPLDGVAGAGGRGVDELRWHKPVRPGDELSIEVDIVDKRPAEHLPGLGQVHAGITGVDRDGDRVVSWTLLGLVERREPA